MRSFLAWLEHRTGIGAVLHEALYERIPGGARWRYVWGSTLVFAFVTQLITGVFLWMAYSPGSRTAWESVYYIQHHMQGGWLLRGIHHYMAHAMVVLLALHLLQVVIDGAYRAPREVNFWMGLVLMGLVLALALTGYLLPWDQKGYWATGVATNLMSQVPWFGPQLQKLVVGGVDYGNHTLTRFFALHAGVLPGLLIAFLVIHVALFRRHGLTTAAARPGLRPWTPEIPHPPPTAAAAGQGQPAEQFFWPDQLLRDAVACLAVLAVVLALNFRGVIYTGFELTPEHLGAELGPPADPSEAFAAARPEWYFLPLFQLLKYFEGGREQVAVVGIPAVLALVLLLMPIIGRWQLGHRFNVVVVGALLIGAVLLTARALQEDWQSESFRVARQEAQQEARRVKQVIAQHGGIPLEGAIHLVRTDPEIQGPRLFAQHCQSCHRYLDPAGNGLPGPEPPDQDAGEPYGAPNLYGFASRQWLAGFLSADGIRSEDYFGRTAHADGEMAGFAQEYLADLDEDQQQALDAIIATLSAEAQLAGQQELDRQAAEQGVRERAIEAMTLEFGCTDCHKFHEHGFEGAPDLTGYGSLAWLKALITNPAHPRFYGDHNDRMPAFADPERPTAAHFLTDEQLEILARWIRGDAR